ncbi:hypothetical protein MMC24_001377 [Lignoscripta atroalba]|nr:hypothetical protein [Lignoscripta atroalba]
MFRSRKGGLDALLDRPRQPWWQRLLASPWRTLAKALYRLRIQTAKRSRQAITVVCISDTHNSQPKVPNGDLLIHAGDLSQSGSVEEVQQQLDWLKSLPHPHKVFIAGNHDMAFESDDKTKLDWDGLVYLQDSSTSIKCPGGRILNIYGSPWTRQHGNWAFQYPAHGDFWSRKLPLDVDILITHMPPRFHLDIDGLGDESLLRELWRTRPALHVFGHLHGGYGKDLIVYDDFEVQYTMAFRGQGVLLAIVRMGYHLLSSALRSRPVNGTWLVNASAVGGLRDDVRRTPIELSI